MVLDPTHMDHVTRIIGDIDTLVSEYDTSHKQDNINDIISKIRETTVKNDTLIKLIDDESMLYKDHRHDLADEYMSHFNELYAIDSGTINPITYANGAVFDICHGLISSVPVRKELERYRTISSLIYVPNNDFNISPDTGWNYYDKGYARSMKLTVSGTMVTRHINDIVHTINMKYTESEHMLWLLDKLAFNSMFIIDGSIYPKELMYWVVDSGLSMMIRYEPVTQRVLKNYVHIMEKAFKLNVPVLGFVKNPTDSQIMRSDTMSDMNNWSNDAQLFQYLLNSCDDTSIMKNGITYTGWFRQENRIYGSSVDRSSPLLDNDNITPLYPPEDYDIAFFMAYIPRTHSLFKIESLYGFVKDPATRTRITRQILSDMALTGSIPKVLNNADHLAKISRYETNRLRDLVDRKNRVYDYNSHRWGGMESTVITNGSYE